MQVQEKPGARQQKELYTSRLITYMNWIPLKNEQDLEALKTKSADKPQVIFKHSTRCNISSIAKNRLERNISPEGLDFNFLDLVANKPLSNKVAEEFLIDMNLPRFLLLKMANAIYDESHIGISMDDIVEHAAK